MRRFLILAFAVTLVLGACDSGGDSEKSEENTTTTEEERSPADSRIDELYEACEGGDDDACDDLYTESEAGSPEEAFGNNCGGRGLPPGEIWCGPERQAQDAPADPEPVPDEPTGDTGFEEVAREQFLGECLEVAPAGTPAGACDCIFDHIVGIHGVEYFVGPPDQTILQDAVDACI